MKEPEYAGLDHQLLLCVKNVESGRVNMDLISKTMGIVVSRSKNADVLCDFMEDYRDLHELWLLGRRQNLKTEFDVFKFMFQEYLAKADRIRGRPGREQSCDEVRNAPRTFWTRFYQAAFMPFRIDDPTGKTDKKGKPVRVFNPTFQAISDMVLIQLIPDFGKVVTYLGRKETTKEKVDEESVTKLVKPARKRTAALIRRLLRKGKKNFTQLTIKERKEVAKALARDYGLKGRELRSFNRSILDVSKAEIERWKSASGPGEPATPGGSRRTGLGSTSLGAILALIISIIFILFPYNGRAAEGEEGPPSKRASSSLLQRLGVKDTKSYTEETIYPGFVVRNYTGGPIETYHIIDSNEYINTRREADGTVKVYTYDASWNLTEVLTHNTDGTIEKDDYIQEHTERWIPGDDFARGCNLPWLTYGFDIGLGANGETHEGFSTPAKRAALYQELSRWSGGVVRVFLFCDLRSGVTFDGSGTTTGFTDHVYEDMDALLDAARALGVKIIPVFFDKTLGDKVSDESGYPVGEHPDLITDPAKRAALHNLIAQFVRNYAGSDEVFAYDAMNEPVEATAVTTSEMQTFLSELIGVIHTEDPGTPVTIGARDEGTVTNWTGLDQ
ncbi:MAG: hypothetical protein ACE5JK_08200, partial [Candidatus Omnitrophota bacterium]